MLSLTLLPTHALDFLLAAGSLSAWILLCAGFLAGLACGLSLHALLAVCQRA